ncbi:hypothetical protein HYX10_02950 [Candidatus Woesearchaeota archaeon]|nr:hypothetical protein [Candidatus Woesearchaeota archaeon]
MKLRQIVIMLAIFSVVAAAAAAYPRTELQGLLQFSINNYDKIKAAGILADDFRILVNAYFLTPVTEPNVITSAEQDQTIAAIGQLRNCNDGTQHASCSLTKPKYCYDAELSDNCITCGCPGSQTCTDWVCTG